MNPQPKPLPTECVCGHDVEEHVVKDAGVFEKDKGPLVAKGLAFRWRVRCMGKYPRGFWCDCQRWRPIAEEPDGP